LEKDLDLEHQPNDRQSKADGVHARAIAWVATTIAMRHGPDVGFAHLDAILGRGELSDYFLLWTWTCQRSTFRFQIRVVFCGSRFPGVALTCEGSNSNPHGTKMTQGPVPGIGVTAISAPAFVTSATSSLMFETTAHKQHREGGKRFGPGRNHLKQCRSY